MAKRLHQSGERWRTFLMLLTLSCTGLAAYLTFSPLFHNSSSSSSSWASQARTGQKSVEQLEEERKGCCRGLEHTEFWGDAVNWGSDFLVNSTQACCNACKTNPKCNSWVYCGDQAKCGNLYRQCWLKKQKDPFVPQVHDTTSIVPWTSGLIFQKDVGIVELVMDNVTIHIKLLPDCAPKSVNHILELLKLSHCSGCRFYRAEGRGHLWDSDGQRVSKTSTGPPYAVVQGTLEAQYFPFKAIPGESRPIIKRGMVGWVGAGLDFFISLADHEEWPRKHTVFATVVEADMPLVENLAKLPTSMSIWGGVEVAVLDNHVNLKLQRPTLL